MSKVEVKELSDLETGRVVRVDTIATGEDLTQANENQTNYTNQEVSKVFDETFEVTKDGMGFPDRGALLEFDDIERRVSIRPNPDIGYFDYYFRGKRVRIEEDVSYILKSNETNQGLYISLDGSGNLSPTGAFPDFKNSVLCFYVYFSEQSNRFIVKGEERHGSDRDTQWHYSKHREDGMVVRQLGALSFVKDDPENVGIQLGITTVADEDLEHTIIPSEVPSQPFEQNLESASVEIPTLIVGSEAEGYFDLQDKSLPWVQDELKVNLPSGSGEYAFSPVDDGKFVNYFLVATHCVEYPIKLISGRVVFDSEVEAADESLESLGLNFPEIAMLYRITLKRDNTLSNVGKCVIAEVSTVSRGVFQSAAASADDHSNLLGRSKPDQHPASSIRDQSRSQNAQASLDQLFISLAEGFIPSGGIMMYTGSVAPDGWAICNGQNNTPDLRDRFIVGAGGNSNIGDTGGSLGKTTVSAGSHTHAVTVGNHTLNIAQVPMHTHDLVSDNGVYTSSTATGSNSSGRGIGASSTAVQPRIRTTVSGGSGSHNHSASSGSSGSHSHDIPDVRPPYYALMFIMKL